MVMWEQKIESLQKEANSNKNKQTNKDKNEQRKTKKQPKWKQQQNQIPIQIQSFQNQLCFLENFYERTLISELCWPNLVS